MPSGTPRPRWWFLITPRWLAWHAFAVLAAWGMLWLGDWQFHRAETGNALSWAYTFEWPVFTVFGVVFWAKTIADEWRSPGGARSSQPTPAGTAPAGAASAGPSLPAAAHTPATSDPSADENDPELAAYNAYLAGLSAGQRPARPQQ